MKRIFVIVSTMLLLGCMSVYAENAPKPRSTSYDPAENRCKVADDESVSSMLNRINEIDKMLPNIPPEEKAYIDAESARGLKIYQDEGFGISVLHTRSAQIFASLQARKYYPVWKLRNALGPARNALENIIQKPYRPLMTSYRNNPEAEKLERATTASFDVNRLGQAVQAFTFDTQGREFEYVSPADYEKLIADREGISMSLNFYMSCKLAKVMGPQKLF